MKDKPPPLPDLDASDLPELRSMQWKDLKKVPHITGHWKCAAEGCRGFKKVRDFGIFPVVWAFDEWLDISDQILLCGLHSPIYKLLCAEGRAQDFPLKPSKVLEAERMEIFGGHRYWEHWEQLKKHRASKNDWII